MTTNTHLLIDEHGMPLAAINVDQIQTDATILGYDLAAAAHDPQTVDKLLEQALTTHGPRGFGYVAAAALKHLTTNILGPVLEVTDRLHDVGSLKHDLREGLTDAANNAKETLR